MNRKTVACILLGVGGIIFVHEMVKWNQSIADRHAKYQQAEAYARSTGKPFLVVGRPMGMYPCGDYNLDLNPKGECPNEIQADIHDLSRFEDKTFGSVFASHVLEHIEDIELGFQELNRIADKVFISYPYHDTLAAYQFEHKWKMYAAPPETDYIEFRRIAGR